MDFTPDIAARVQPLMDHLEEEKARLMEKYDQTDQISLEDQLDLLLAHERQKAVYQTIDALFKSPDNLGHDAIMALAGPISIMRMLVLNKIG